MTKKKQRMPQLTAVLRANLPAIPGIAAAFPEIAIYSRAMTDYSDHMTQLQGLWLIPHPESPIPLN